MMIDLLCGLGLEAGSRTLLFCQRSVGSRVVDYGDVYIKARYLRSAKNQASQMAVDLLGIVSTYAQKS